MRTVILISALLFLCFGSVLHAQTLQSEAITPEEYLLLGNATRGAGEPMLAVDPTNPRNIVVIAMGSLHRLEDAPISRSQMEMYHKTAYSTLPLLAVTHDGGRIWKFSVFPILHGKFKRCPDPFAQVLNDGTFLVGCEPRYIERSAEFTSPSAVPYMPGGQFMLISTDHGDTWSQPPIPLITSWSAKRFAPGLKPYFGGVASPWDRPFVRVDRSTGIVYDQAGGGETSVGAKPGHYRNQSYLTSSSDGGHHFGTIYSWDSEQYPELGRGTGYDAGHGYVAVVYVASKAPGHSCPCEVMGLSHDRGKTFKYHVLPNIPVPKDFGTRPPFQSEPGTFPGVRGEDVNIVADPAKAGRWALLWATRTQLKVAFSDDNGETWTPWAVAGEVPGTQETKSWITYSPTGQLALMWRAVQPDGSYEIWTAVSKGDSDQFSAPLRISAQPSPYRYPNRDDGLFGDDVEEIVFGGPAVYMVWGDSRSGFLGSWFAREPLSAYHFTAAAK